MANWATAAEVLAYTGQSVTDAQITLAQGVMDVYTGVTEDATANLTARDLRLLKQACAYQTVWMVNQVDVFTRTDVTAVRQDGMEFDQASEDALILAPLAKRCIERLSWRKPRALCVRGSRDRFRTHAQYAEAWMTDDLGQAADWRPAS